MERLPKIILMIAAMTAIFLWVSTAFNSCGDKDLVEEMEVVEEDLEDDVFSDDLGDDIFGDSSDDEDLLFEEAEEAEVTEEEYYEETDFTSEVDDTPAYTPPPSRPAAPSSNSSGEYMVIAGNYLIESNARDMINKLGNLGYNNAEIGIFERSQYHTVIASRHSSQSAAIQVSSDIKYKGIEAYVKKKTY